jgi:hypothetical protein
MSLVPSLRSQRAAGRDFKRRRKTNTVPQPNSIFESPITQQPPQCNMSNMVYGVPSTAFEATYSETRARFCFNYQRVTSDQTRTDSIRHSPLVSLAVKYAVDYPAPKPSPLPTIRSAAPRPVAAISSAALQLQHPPHSSCNLLPAQQTSQSHREQPYSASPT